MQLRFLGDVPALFQCCCSRDQNPRRIPSLCEARRLILPAFDKASFKITNTLSPPPLVCVLRRVSLYKRKTAERIRRLFFEGVSGNAARFPSPSFSLLSSLNHRILFIVAEESNSLKLPPRSRRHKSTPCVKGGLMAPGELPLGAIPGELTAAEKMLPEREENASRYS